MTDPTRLRDGGGSSELRTLIVRAEEDMLSDASEARLAASLAAAGIPVDSAPRVGAIRKPWWSAGKAGLLVSLLVGSAALGVAYRGMSRGEPASATIAPPTLAASSAKPALAPVASFAEIGSALPPPASAAPSPPRPLGARRAAEAPSASPEIASPPSPREGLLLMQARQALDSDPARALELVLAHERQFPRSQLAPERATLRREALARMPP